MSIVNATMLIFFLLILKSYSQIHSRERNPCFFELLLQRKNLTTKNNMENRNNRIVFLDYLRVLACLMVMLIHSSECTTVWAQTPMWPTLRTSCGFPCTMDSAAWQCHFS